VSDRNDDRTVRTAMVLVAHGSRAAAANAAHQAVAERLASELDASVRAAYLELAEPSIGDAIDAAAADGATRIIVLPHFLYPGRHVAEDIPAIVTEAAARHPAVEVELTAPSGDDPAMVRLLADLAGRALGR
jgi:sirohydrochlorin cobaltochelatase